MSDMDELHYDCSHYKRKCLLVAPCCKKSYPCRICHDAAEDHKIERHKVAFVICSQCGVEQKVATNCRSCGILFGNYSCLTCRLFDDNTDKKQFHCDGCGICRIGGRENYFHCEKCNMCLTINIKDTHTCIENISKCHCPVCLEDIHSSRDSVHIPGCGHLLHYKCYSGMLRHGNTKCPVCSKSLVDLTEHWKLLDYEIENTEMPEPYRNYRVNILCCDCLAKSKVLFHVYGLKCQSCGSYNTVRHGNEDEGAPAFDDAGNLVRELTLDSTDSEDSWELLSEEVTTDEAEEATEENNSEENAHINPSSSVDTEVVSTNQNQEHSDREISLNNTNNDIDAGHVNSPNDENTETDFGLD